MTKKAFATLTLICFTACTVTKQDTEKDVFRILRRKTVAIKHPVKNDTTKTALVLAPTKIAPLPEPTPEPIKPEPKPETKPDLKADNASIMAEVNKVDSMVSKLQAQITKDTIKQTRKRSALRPEKPKPLLVLFKNENAKQLGVSKDSLTKQIVSPSEPLERGLSWQHIALPAIAGSGMFSILSLLLLSYRMGLKDGAKKKKHAPIYAEL